MIPNGVFLTGGVGVHRQRLGAFEAALRAAGIERQNLVTVSSILPPGCAILTAAEGRARLQAGAITYCIMARCETDEPGRRIAAGIGLAHQQEGPPHHGYISEHHDFGIDATECGQKAEELAATMLASTLGFELDPAEAWNERRQAYEHSGLKIETCSQTAAGTGDPAGRWTCAVSAAVFLFRGAD